MYTCRQKVSLGLIFVSTIIALHIAAKGEYLSRLGKHGMRHVGTGDIGVDRKSATFQNMEPPRATDDACTANTDLVFVKTHKTAGSTLGHVLGAHRIRRGLRAKMSPFPAPHFGGYPVPFSRKLAVFTQQRTSLKSNHFFVSGHMRFHRKEIEAIVTPTAKYITVLRSPWKVFESAFHYYYGSFKKFIPQRVTSSCHFEPYLSVTKDFEVGFSRFIQLANGSLTRDVPWYFRSKNFQSHDLGLDPMNDDEDYIMNHARELDFVFDLVFIADFFLESLVLLKETLCIEWEDLIVPNMKQGSYVKHVYSEDEKEIVQRINKQDFMLYDYFNKTLWRKVERYGHERMAKDVAKLKSLFEKEENKRHPIDDGTLRKKRTKRAVRRKRSLPTFVPKSEHVDILMERIYARSNVQNVTDEFTRNLAKEMIKYAGWCPY